MVRFRTLAIVALALAATAGCERQASEKALASGPLPPTVASRVWVLGGDSLIIDGQHIRLANAFAPQTIPDARCWSEAVAAKFAIQRVKDWMRSARTIQIEPTGERDTYNRAIARVSLDGVDIGDQLFHEGLAGQPATGRFEWCSPVSVDQAGVPDWAAYGENGRP
jgi:hypothetical protein